MNFPIHSCHLFTSSEISRLNACKAALRRAGSLAVPLPDPPVDGKGAPDHTRAALLAYVSSFETVTATNVAVASANAAIAGLRALILRASAADPVGLGSWAGGDLVIGLRGLPPVDADPAAYCAAVGKLVVALTAKIRNAYRGE